MCIFAYLPMRSAHIIQCQPRHLWEIRKGTNNHCVRITSITRRSAPQSGLWGTIKLKYLHEKESHQRWLFRKQGIKYKRSSVVRHGHWISEYLLSQTHSTKRYSPCSQNLALFQAQGPKGKITMFLTVQLQIQRNHSPRPLRKMKHLLSGLWQFVPCAMAEIRDKILQADLGWI